MSLVRPTSINYPNYLGTEVGGTVLKPRLKNKIRRYVLTLASELEIWSFRIVDLQRTEKKCTNFHTARAERLFCSLNVIIIHWCHKLDFDWL